MMGPKKGSLEYILLSAMVDNPEGVTFLDLEGTGITEENIEQIAENLRNGLYESDDDNLLKFDA